MDARRRIELQTLLDDDRGVKGSPGCTVCRLEKLEPTGDIRLVVQLEPEAEVTEHPRLLVTTLEKEIVDEVDLSELGDFTWEPGTDFTLPVPWRDGWPEGGLASTRFHLLFATQHGEEDVYGPLEYV